VKKTTRRLKLVKVKSRGLDRREQAANAISQQAADGIMKYLARLQARNQLKEVDRDG
jgi:hypothetical protein